MIRLSKIAFTSAFLVAIIVVTAVQRVEAGTWKVTGSESGTNVTVPVDLDGSGTTCTTVGGVTTCPADSNTGSYIGRATGPFGGPFTGENIIEAVSVSGTGCLIAPTTIQSCTLGAVANACEYQYVTGAAGADIRSATGSISSYTITDGTICFDFSSGLPFNYAGTQTSSISGGTGEFTGVTGSRTYTFTGAVTAVDPAGHGFGWVTSTFTGTLTK